jgi:hypothetical protein
MCCLQKKKRGLATVCCHHTTKSTKTAISSTAQHFHRVHPVTPLSIHSFNYYWEATLHTSRTLTSKPKKKPRHYQPYKWCYPRNLCKGKFIIVSNPSRFTCKGDGPVWHCYNCNIGSAYISPSFYLQTQGTWCQHVQHDTPFVFISVSGHVKVQIMFIHFTFLLTHFYSHLLFTRLL